MKTACVYHSIDLDGWMSAAIVKHWFKENNNGFIKDTENNFCNFIGYNYGQPIPDLSEYDKVIMCDISFPKEEMEKLFNRLDNNLIYIDHHISAMIELCGEENIYKDGHEDSTWLNGLRNTKFAACELTYKYFFPNEQMPEIVRLLGMYDSFRHKGTDEEQKVLEFQYGARQCIFDYEDAYSCLLRTERKDVWLNILNNIWDNGKSIYQYLCTEAKQVYKNGFEIKFNQYDKSVIKEIMRVEGKSEDDIEWYDSKQLKYKFICINKERFNPINFGINYHDATVSPDGKSYDGAACFHYANGEWHFSLYNDNGEVDCSAIAKQYGGGGHKGASGFIIKDINQIINNK